MSPSSQISILNIRIHVKAYVCLFLYRTVISFDVARSFFFVPGGKGGARNLSCKVKFKPFQMTFIGRPNVFRINDC